MKVTLPPYSNCRLIEFRPGKCEKWHKRKQRTQTNGWNACAVRRARAHRLNSKWNGTTEVGNHNVTHKHTMHIGIGYATFPPPPSPSPSSTSQCVQWIRNATKFLIWHRKHFNFIFYLEFFFSSLPFFLPFLCSRPRCNSDIFLFVWSFLRFSFLSKLNAQNCTRQILDTVIFRRRKQRKMKNARSELWKWCTYPKSNYVYANRYPPLLQSSNALFCSSIDFVSPLLLFLLLFHLKDASKK